MPTDFDQEALTYDQNPMRFERARAVADGIRAGVQLKPGMSALEYGCGTGLLSFALLPDLGQVTLVDSSTGMLAAVRRKIAEGAFANVSALQADFLAEPLPDLRVDLIYTLMTLHHIPDTDRILRAFYTLLHPGGALCVADLDQEDGSFHGTDDLTVHRGFNRAELGERARQAGFQNVSFSTVYHTPRRVGDEMRSFPLFLMVAKRGQ